MSLVSVIVPNWNGAACIGRCLECVLAQTYEPIETIVVDNGSEDGSPELVDGHAPRVRMIRSDRNRGFAWAQNRGIRASRGRYLLSLNSDLFLTPHFVETAVRYAAENPDVGTVAGKTLSCGTEEVFNVGVYLRKRVSMVNSPNTERPEFVFGASGSVALYTREMVEDVEIRGEFFDESYFAFGEDIDLAWRAQLFGWKTVYAPDALAYHIGSASVGGAIRLVDKPARFQRHALRNRYTTITKNASWGILLRLLPHLLLAETLTWPYLLLRIPGRVPYLLGAISEYLRSLPDTLAKRRIVQNRRRMDDRYIWRFFRGF